MTEPLVTVIILTYNQEKVIGEAIESVLDQDCGFPYEILIGEDASPDGTRGVCEKYAAKYPDKIRLMPSAPNKGIVDNYFDCVEAARGRYIADCAGDDRWCHRGRLREMVSRLEEDPTLTAVYSDSMIVNPDDPEQNRVCAPAEWSDGKRHRGEDILRCVLDNTNYLPYVLSTAVYRRGALLDVMRTAPDIVRNRDFGMEDVPVIAALASKGDALHFPAVTLEYVQGDETVSNSRSLEKLIRFYCRSLDCSLILGRHYGLREEQMANGFRTKADYLAACAFNSSDPEMARLVVNSLSRWHLPLPAKARLHLLLMRSRTLWKAARAIKRKIIFKND